MGRTCFDECAAALIVRAHREFSGDLEAEVMDESNPLDSLVRILCRSAANFPSIQLANWAVNMSILD